MPVAAFQLSVFQIKYGKFSRPRGRSGVGLGPTEFSAVRAYIPMKRFKSPRQVQRFLSVHDQVANLFPRRRDHDTAANIGSGRTRAFATWTGVTGVAMAA
jgi:hypothetical protein